MAQEPYKPLPRTPDKDSDPRHPTFHDWQAKELVRESRSMSRRKMSRKLNREARKYDRAAKRKSGRRN